MKAGDNVEFTKVKRTRNGFSMKQVEAVIVSVCDETGKSVVKLRNGKTGSISTEKLHLIGSGPNQLTRLVHDMAEAR